MVPTFHITIDFSLNIPEMTSNVAWSVFLEGLIPSCTRQYNSVLLTVSEAAIASLPVYMLLVVLC